tara:strand:- start:638 stop:2269 length:1632 start_codon:yes stop_codon:yes gene_type:complete
MAEPTIQLGGGNWAGKSDNLLGYYKEGERFYKQDFTFSRSTTGTYTDSEGYIQEMPYNKLTYSNDFSNAAWVKDRCTLTSGQSGYDGSNDAWLIQSTATSASARCYQAFNSDGNFNRSVYAKKGTSDYLAIYTTNIAYAYFNLSNGTIGTESNNVNASILSVGNGWYRCSVTMSNVYDNHYIFVANVDNNTSTNSGDNIYIQDAQVNSGTSAKTYFPTTTRLNIPRVDYLNNSNGSLLLEPQRTNLITYSEDFTQWATNATITPNSAISPDGTLNASLFSHSGGSFPQVTLSGITFVSGADYIPSLYVKSDGTSQVQHSLLVNNIVINFTPTDEWVRISDLIVSPDTSGSFVIAQNSASSVAASFYIYGAQLEQGSYATTLINTSGSSVTRNQDVCSISNVADRIGQTEGTLYGEFDLKDNLTGTRRLLCLTDGTSTNRITTYINGLDKLSVYIVDGGAAQADIQATILTEGTIKYALAYANNSIKLYLNGTQVGTDTSATIPSTSDFLVGFEYSGSSSYFNWRNCQLYSTALSDSELATLTT